LLGLGYTVDQVVHDYGDLCQAITEMAARHGASIKVYEFSTLNRCLDNGIADAVKEFGRQLELSHADQGLKVSNERKGAFAHELRTHLHTAKLAVAAMKSGNVGLAGATGGVLDSSLCASLDDLGKRLGNMPLVVCDMEGISARALEAFTTRARAKVPRLALVRVDAMDSGDDIVRKVLALLAPAEQSATGLGIGLSLVRGVVELHGGSVSAASDGPGKGSRFEARLPLAEAALRVVPRAPA